MNKKKVIAIIPARAGSKGLKDKNVLPLAGLPLIAYTIKAAKESNLFEKIIVSTDSSEYADIAKKYGAEVPFIRPDNISSDEAGSAEVILHSLKLCKEIFNEIYDEVILLQPTSPLRTGQHIVEAYKKFREFDNESDISLVSVQEISKKYRWIMQQKDNWVEFCMPVKNEQLQRQHSERLFIPNGAIYIARIHNFSGNFYNYKTLFYLMDFRSSVDIDTIEDFKIAEELIKS